MKTVLHPNQVSVAKALGIDAAQMTSAEEAIIAIETSLGKASMELRARWFVVSVLRHLMKAKWVGLDDCSVDEARQRDLTRDCLAVKGFATSLRTVTKDTRSRFRLVGFASAKNIDRGMLSTGTKAYKIAASIVLQSDLFGTRAQAASSQPKPDSKQDPMPKTNPKRAESKVVEKSVVGRRAKRRGYVGADLAKEGGTTEVQSPEDDARSMSEEEFASLDAALSKSDAEIVQQNWIDQAREDRRSRILGILAGVGFFVFIALLFL